MTLVCVDPDNTLLIDGWDLQELAAITSAEGLLTDPPQRADIITQDWTAGAIYQAGPKQAWTFEVPLIMRAAQQDVALAQLRAFQAMVGDQKTLTRRIVVDGTVVNELCQAVMVASPQVQWDFSARAQIRCVLIWQGLTPWVAA